MKKSKITDSDKEAMIMFTATYKNITAKMLKKKVPGYRRQQYAAIIAHVTMGTYYESHSKRSR
jgi:hypothetical protein